MTGFFSILSDEERRRLFSAPMWTVTTEYRQPRDVADYFATVEDPPELDDDDVVPDETRPIEVDPIRTDPVPNEGEQGNG